ncbi:hypothetical protein [Candidatus Thiodiazotropha endoloripes]|uniref:hypothetical protein n=1 Tax=Candidatus Thiodiazotropha endoloripes TaxID=1818881 RepID=UPI000B188CE8|nr:hypothetical protein [Candidatus Thiodiazotropha endoloripes]
MSETHPSAARNSYNTTIRVIALVLALGTMMPAVSGPREQAKRIHDRIAGVPPSADTLAQMVDEIENNNDPLAAAMLAIEHPGFYNVTLKNWATPWTNEDQTPFAPLNDYTATVIGMVRDEVPFNQLLSADIIYTGSNSPAYSNSNNDHYETMENQGLDLKQVLQQNTQSSVTGLPPEGTAGVITTRASARAFFIDGTNRSMFRFTMLNHLCKDLELIKDPTRPSDRVRQDASRSPGGDSRVYFNNCVGCHAGMEPLGQAYAYYNFEYTDDPEIGTLAYTPGSVQPKYLINSSVFKDGYTTPDDRWDNYWREGPNASLGWDSNLPGTGYGAKSMGEELANSHAFAECQVTKAFQAVCLRAPVDRADRNKIAEITSSFKSGYNMKHVFAHAAVHCAGE